MSCTSGEGDPVYHYITQMYYIVYQSINGRLYSLAIIGVIAKGYKI